MIKKFASTILVVHALKYLLAIQVIAYTQLKKHNYQCHEFLKGKQYEKNCFYFYRNTGTAFK